MKIKKRLLNSKGFTLIELLLVVGIIGVLLAIIIPKAIRTSIDAKYGIVEKNCGELKSYAVQWAEKAIRAQDEQNSTATLIDYYASLAAVGGGGAGGSGATQGQQWIATNAANNWNIGTVPAPGTPPTPTFLAINGRVQLVNGALVGPPAAPEDTVEQIIPPEKVIKNPFNGSNVFRSPNDPPNKPGGAGPVTGAIALGFMQEPINLGGYYYFAFAYQGTDSTTFALPTTQSTDGTTFHAGSGLATIAGLRNGVLFARIR